MRFMGAEGFALSIVVLLFSVIVHEVMHGFVALKFGDDTAERQGRLTLNPIPHIDPIGTILVPGLLLISSFLTGSALIFGWAKPVPVNPLKFNNIKKGEIAVSLAGILANFGLALIAVLIYHILTIWFSNMIYIEIIQEVLQFTVYINLLLGIFNLIPIPPLDGSKVLMALLPYNAARNYQQVEKYGFFILFAMIIIPIGGTTIIGILVSIVDTITRTLLG